MQNNEVRIKLDINLQYVDISRIPWYTYSNFQGLTFDLKVSNKSLLTLIRSGRGRKHIILLRDTGFELENSHLLR